MGRTVRLVGVDVGSTTTSLVAAHARLVTTTLGKVEIVDVEPTYLSELAFTPFHHDLIDEAQLATLLDTWIDNAGLTGPEIFGGGALVTGLAAQSNNAAAVTRLIEDRLTGAVVALAGDPRLEAWLAFMGNCHAISLADSQTPLVNLDIGGGTTNLAWGQAAQVDATASLMVGARHFQFLPGTYQLRKLSRHGQALLAHLAIGAGPGDTLGADQIARICGAYVDLIVAAMDADEESLQGPLGRLLVQAPGTMRAADRPAARITLSGGVGRLAYRHLRGEAHSVPSEFGDLGGELAAQLIERPAIAQRLLSARPEALGRATVLGLMRHGSELSGTTLYLPNPERLPLPNVPILGRIDAHTTDAQLAGRLELVARCHPAGCLQVDLDAQDLPAARHVADQLRRGLARQPLSDTQTLVLLMAANLGKLLGGYITNWGTRGPHLIVVDEVPLRNAQFVRLGSLRDAVVPLWLFAPLEHDEGQPAWQPGH